MKTKNSVLSACLVLSLAVQAFNKEDVHFVVGEGDSQCYFVIDWYGTQKCWAFRWRSTSYTPNVFEALKAIDHEDPRFKIAHGSMTAAFVNIYFMGYDEADCACQWDVENGCSSSSAAFLASSTAFFINFLSYAILFPFCFINFMFFCIKLLNFSHCYSILRTYVRT